MNKIVLASLLLLAVTASAMTAKEEVELDAQVAELSQSRVKCFGCLFSMMGCLFSSCTRRQVEEAEDNPMSELLKHTREAMQPDRDITRAHLLELLDATSLCLAGKGTNAKVFVLGGSVAVLDGARGTTHDIDFYWPQGSKKTDQDALNECIKEAARNTKTVAIKGYTTWMNMGPSAISSKDAHLGSFTESKEVYRSDNGHLILVSPTLYYALAQKVEKFLSKQQAKDVVDGKHLLSLIDPDKKATKTELSNAIWDHLADDKRALTNKPAVVNHVKAMMEELGYASAKVSAFVEMSRGTILRSNK